MKNNLITKLICRTVFCTVSFFTILFITGFFSMGGHGIVTFSDDIFYYYTNLSNYFCFGVMIACICEDVKQLRLGKLYGYNQNRYLKHIKFAATVIISMTMIVYGFLLGEPNTIQFWNDIENVCCHVACPLLFIMDALLFDEHKSIGYLDPVLAILLPLVYVVVIEVRGACTGGYPYFFLNMNRLGFGGLMRWLGILLIAFIAIGYLLFLYDKLVKIDGKWKLDFSKTLMFGFLVK